MPRALFLAPDMVGIDVRLFGGSRWGILKIQFQCSGSASSSEKPPNEGDCASSLRLFSIQLNSALLSSSYTAGKHSYSNSNFG